MGKKILHIHPNKIMADIFLTSINKAEVRAGFDSKVSHISGYKILLIYKELNKFRPDILISHNSTNSPLILMLGRIMGVKKVIYYNHGIPYLGHKSIMKLILFLIESINCMLAHILFSVSKDMCHILRKKTTKKIFLSQPGSISGIDINTIKHTKINEIRAQYGIKSKTIVISYIGRPKARKGFILMLQLWTKYFLGDNRYILILCGPSTIDIEKAGFTNTSNIITMGMIEHKKVLSVLKDTNIMILPSLHEGLSTCVLEALAIGCSVITFNIPGIRQLITHGLNGILLDASKNKNEILNQIYNSIQYILNNKVIAKKMTLNGISLAQQYNRKSILAEHIKIIRKISDIK